MAVIVGTQVSLRYAVEATRGTTATVPGTAQGYTTGNYKLLRATGRNINLKKDLLESAEVSVSRQRSDVRHGFNRVEGEIGFEFSPGSYDELLAYAMARPHLDRTPANNTQVALTGAGSYDGWYKASTVVGAELSIGTVGTLGSPDTGGAHATSTLPGYLIFALDNGDVNTNWIDLGYRPGDWVVSSGFVSALNNSTGANPAEWKVLSASATLLVVQIPAGNTTAGVAAAGAAGNQLEFKGRKLCIGTTLSTVTLERALVDGTASNTYQQFKGCTVNTLQMSIRPDALVGGTFGFIGMSGSIAAGASVAGTPTTVSTSSPFAAFDGSATLTTAAGVHVSAIVTGLDFTFDNQRTLFPVVGSKFSYDVYEGVNKVEGTISLLLDSTTMLAAFENETSVNTITVRLNEVGATGVFYSLVFRNVKLTTADMDPPQNGPVVITAGFTALEQTFTGNAAERTRECFQIQRSTTTLV